MYALNETLASKFGGEVTRKKKEVNDGTNFKNCSRRK